MDEQTNQSTNGMAIAALILGIAGLIFLPIIGAALALIFGLIALSKIKHTGQNGRGMAIAGIIMGALGIIILPLLMAIGGLAYFGVLSPAKMLPNKCTMTGGFSCVEFDLDSQNLMIKVQNNLGLDADSVIVKLDSSTHPACSATHTLGPMNNGEIKTLNFPCETYERFLADLEIEYIKSEETLNHKTTGHISIKRD